MFVLKYKIMEQYKKLHLYIHYFETFKTEIHFLQFDNLIAQFS